MALTDETRETPSFPEGASILMGGDHLHAALSGTGLAIQVASRANLTWSAQVSRRRDTLCACACLFPATVSVSPPFP